MTEYHIDNNNDLIALAHSLGQPVSSRLNGPLIDQLIPRHPENAHPQSISANFGIKDFPFHTDGAYFPNPPRKIILRYVQGIENPTPTLLKDMNELSEEDRLFLKHSIWKVSSRKSFYSTILSDDNRFYRFDPCVMRPLNHDSSALVKIIENLPVQTIYWEINKTVVINNWSYLHNRPEVKPDEINFRTLQRIMIL